jgi:hypothetical protein
MSIRICEINLWPDECGVLTGPTEHNPTSKYGFKWGPPCRRPVGHLGRHDPEGDTDCTCGSAPGSLSDFDYASGCPTHGNKVAEAYLHDR